jgi:hypothetical protein
MAQDKYLDSDIIVKFFEEKIENNQQIMHDMRMEGFLCIQSMFLLLNSYENTISVLK